MLYPAELRVRAGSITRLGRTGPAVRRAHRSRAFVQAIESDQGQNRSETGVSAAILAAIAGGILVAGVVRGAVIIGEGAGLDAGAVIVDVADRIGEAVPVMMVMVTTRLRLVRQCGQCGQNGCGSEKLQSGHPVLPVKAGTF
jgi:hypothetical protein